VSRKNEIDAIVVAESAAEHERLDAERQARQDLITTIAQAFRVEMRTFFTLADIQELQINVDPATSDEQDIHASLVYGGRVYDFVRRAPTTFGTPGVPGSPTYLIKVAGDVMSCPTLDLLLYAIALNHIRQEWRAGR
jgi:hypothetical protein